MSDEKVFVGESLSDARIFNSQNLKNGCTCSICEQHIESHSRPITKSMADGIILLSQYSSVGEFVHVDSFFKSHDRTDIVQGGDFAKLRFFGLIEPKIGINNNGSTRMGLWSITLEGVRFAQGLTRVPSSVEIYNNTCLSVNSKLVMIDQITVTGFDRHSDELNEVSVRLSTFESGLSTSSFTSTSDARDFVMNNLANGVECPGCGQWAEIHENAMSSTMMQGLIATSQAPKDSAGFVHVPSVCRKAKLSWGVKSSLLRHWGLYEQSEVSAGYYRITDKGYLFLAGMISLPRTIRLYNSRFIGYKDEQDQIFIDQSKVSQSA